VEAGKQIADEFPVECGTCGQALEESCECDGRGSTGGFCTKNRYSLPWCYVKQGCSSAQLGKHGSISFAPCINAKCFCTQDFGTGGTCTAIAHDKKWCYVEPGCPSAKSGTRGSWSEEPCYQQTRGNDINPAKIGTIPCPFIAALVANGKLIPRGDLWASTQAEQAFESFIFPAIGDTMYSNTIKHLLLGSFFGASFHIGIETELSLYELPLSKLHTFHTGIRLANVGDPAAWEGPCQSYSFLRVNDSCGHTGPHAEVFDELARMIGKTESAAVWDEVDLTQLCEKSRALFYTQGSQCSRDTGGTCAFGDCDSSRGDTVCNFGKCLCAEGSCPVEGKCYQYDGTVAQQEPYPQGSGGGSDICSQLYGMAYKVLGQLTTQEWRDFLVDAVLPQSYELWRDFPVMK